MKYLCILVQLLISSFYLSSQNEQANGASPGDLLWAYSFSNNYVDRAHAPVLTPDSNLIWITYNWNGIPDSEIICLNTEGDTLWKRDYMFGRCEGGAMIVPEFGWILAGTENKLFCLNPDGSDRWIFYCSGEILHSPVIDSMLNFYIAVDETLYAVDSSGNFIWEFESPEGNICSDLTIDRYGVIYFGTENDRLIAVRSNGTMAFNKQLFGYVRSSPTIDYSGTIYMTSSNFTTDQSKIEAFNPSGELLWNKIMNEPHPSAALIADSNHIYVRTLNFWDGGFGKLYKINKITQETIWTYQFGPDEAGAWDLALADDGTIFFATTSAGGSLNGRIYAINPDGTSKWILDPSSVVPGDITPYNSVLIGRNGNVFASCINDDNDSLYLLAISEPGISLANTAWPMHKHDQYNTGKASSVDYLGPQSNIEFDKLVIDFGFVLPGDSVLDTLTVYNTGQKTLELDWLLSSDFFIVDTVANQSNYNYNTLILPGDSLKFFVSFSSADTAMYQDTLIFLSNDYNQPYSEIILKAKTTIEGEVKWIKKLEGYLSSPAIDELGNIYVSGSKVWSINSFGNIKWEYQPPDERLYYNFLNVTISNDNNRIYAPYYNNLIALDSSGNQQWLYYTNPNNHISALALNENGNVIFVDRFNLGGSYVHCIGDEGGEIWKYHTGFDLAYNAIIDKNRNIIAGGLDYEDYDRFVSLSSEGQLNWQEHFIMSGPATIDAENNIYVAGKFPYTSGMTPTVRKYSENGVLLWYYPFIEVYYNISTSIVTAENGNLIVGANSMSNDGALLFCFSSDGNMLWSKEFNGAINSTPAIAKNGTINFGCSNGYFYVLNPDGSEKWHIETEAESFSSAVIHIDGTIYFTTDEEILYVVYGENGGLANSSWPMLQHDTKHTSAIDSLLVSTEESKNDITESLSLLASPNPFQYGLKFTWKSYSSSLGTLKIFGVYSNIVSSFNITCMIGNNYFVWNGENENGIPVPPGIYICCLTVDDKTDCIILIKK